MQQGDIILIPFPFTDLKGSKNRLALILIAGNLDITVSFISTKLHWQEAADLLLHPNSVNGLKKPSLIRIGKMATIDKSLVIGKLGNLNFKEIGVLHKKLIQIFEIKMA